MNKRIIFVILLQGIFVVYNVFGVVICSRFVAVLSCSLFEVEGMATKLPSISMGYIPDMFLSSKDYGLAF
jgi:hypothetical protein